MAKKSPEQLREKAKRLLAQAEKLEKEKFIKLGKLVFSYAENNFKDFEIEEFKAKVLEVLK